MINLNSPDIMDANEASKIWCHAENYVRRMYQEHLEKFPEGSIRKFGKQWIVTTEGMEAITGVKDPRKDNSEVWKDIPGYEGLYEVSNQGRVRSVDRIIPNPKNGKVNYPVRGKIRKLEKAHDGYLRIALNKEGKSKKYFVHRLVMNAFSPNPDPEHLTQVNHKNEITNDNRLENLEWCSQTYNNNYGGRIRKQARSLVNGKKAKRVAQYDLEGNLIKIWESTRECGRHGFKHSGVGACCLGKWDKYKGYRWKYLD